MDYNNLKNMKFADFSEVKTDESSDKWKNSITRQNAKIMVFDRYSNAIAKPILKIDENEIEASHAASVGKISDDEMFYLTSRGLSEEMAKELITLGYLKPIVSEFKDDDVRESILKLIEERM